MKGIKKIFAVLFALTLLLCGCGAGGNNAEAESEAANVDLEAFYNSLKEEFGWEDAYFAEMDDELMEAFYPGLNALNAKQLIVKMPNMSAVVNEYVFAEYENEEDAAAAAEILQERVTMQAEGGAWYPESMEQWGKATVLTNGNYVAMIAGGEQQAAIEEMWNAQFQA